MNITRRQEIFIHRFLDLYRELDGPVHYTVLAERVGVSRFTAYDMLRVLEEKGLVTSEYRIQSEKPVVGRSEVVFVPTAYARQRFVELAGTADPGDWDSVKKRITETIRDGELQDQATVEEVLARVPPDVPAVLRYCIEVMTIIVLRLGKGTGRQILAAILPQIIKDTGSVTRSGLVLLGGFALGLLAYEGKGDLEWRHLLLEHIERYQSLVANMEPSLCRRLGESMNAVVVPMLKS